MRRRTSCCPSLSLLPTALVPAEFLVPDRGGASTTPDRGSAARRALCKMVLDALVADKFLCVKSDGAYARLTEGVTSRPRPVKADLRVEQRIATAS